MVKKKPKKKKSKRKTPQGPRISPSVTGLIYPKPRKKAKWWDQEVRF